MKKIIALLVAASFAMPAMSAETKKVCHDKVVKGKTVQQCKTIKVHKKFEGTKVPTPAPKAKPAAKKPAPKKK